MRESIFSGELQKILHKVEKQSYTPKNPGNSRKLGSNTKQHMGHRGSVQEARIENLNPQVINRNTIIREEAVNRLIGVFSAVLGLSMKIILSQGRLLPALWQLRAQLTQFPAPSALTTGHCGVYS